MLRLGFGLLIICLVAAAQAAQPDADYFAPKLNLLSTQFVHSGTDFLPPYQLRASVVIIRPSDIAPSGLGSGSSAQQTFIAKPQQDTYLTIDSNWHQSYDGGDYISLPRLFRIEFKVAQLNFALRPHSVSINRERLRIVFEPHSASMLWRSKF